MKLYVLFHHYEDDFSLMPNAVAVSDEYIHDTAGPEFWEEEKKRAIVEMGPGSFREAVITVSDRFVQELFQPKSTVAITEEPA